MQASTLSGAAPAFGSPTAAVSKAMESLNVGRAAVFDDESVDESPVKRGRDAELSDNDVADGNDLGSVGPPGESDSDADPPLADVNNMFAEFSAILEASDDDAGPSVASQSSTRRKFKSKRPKQAKKAPVKAPLAGKPHHITKFSDPDVSESESEDPLNASGSPRFAAVSSSRKARRATVLDDEDEEDDGDSEEDNGAESAVASRPARRQGTVARRSRVSAPEAGPPVSAEEEEAVEAEAAAARAAGDERLAEAKLALDAALEGGPGGWHVARTHIPVGKAVAISGRSRADIRVLPGSSKEPDTVLAAATLVKTSMAASRATRLVCHLQLLRSDSEPSSWAVWMRAGRAGARGKGTLVECGSEPSSRSAALKRFRSLFRARTGRDWADVVRAAFKPLMGKFALAGAAQHRHALEATTDGQAEARTVEPAVAEVWAACVAEAAAAGATRGLAVNARGIDWQAMASHLPSSIMRHLASMETVVKAVAQDSDDEDEVPLAAGGRRLQAVSSPAIVSLAATIHALLPLTAFKPADTTTVSVEQVEAAFHTVRSLADAARARLLAHHALERAATVHPADIFAARARCRLTPSDVPTAAFFHDLGGVAVPGAAFDVTPTILPPSTPASANSRLLWRCYRKAEMVAALTPCEWTLPSEAPVAPFSVGRGFDFFESPGDAFKARAFSDLSPSNLIMVGFAVACGREFGLAAPRFLRAPPPGYHSVACICKNGLRPFAGIGAGLTCFIDGATPAHVDGMWADAGVDANGDDVAEESQFDVNRFVVFDSAQVRARLMVLLDSL